MIEVQMDSDDESLRAKMALRKSPGRKKRFHMLLVAITAVSILFAVLVSDGFSDALIRSLIVLFVVPFILWALIATTYPIVIGSIVNSSHVLSGNKKAFQYVVNAGGILELSEGKERNYPFSEYIYVEQNSANLVVVFKYGLLLLPIVGFTQGTPKEFMAELERHVTSQGSRDAVTGAPA